ncbi:hypothetical protein SAMN05216303_1011174 [Rhodoferax sp. OV413]|nr:hypothetical protein SAMN05216303_1011174 [Rhodoferax sp. OV413]
MRIATVVWAAIGSLVIHTAILGLLWPTTPPQRISDSPSTSVIQARLLTETSTQKEEEARTSGQLQAAVIAPEPPLVTPRKTKARSNHDTPNPIAAATSAEQSIPTAPSREGYLPIEKVDQPATPLGDWEIDPEMLPRNTTLRVAIQLWISAQGTIDYWDLLDTSISDPDLVQKALATIEQTRLQPALLNHTAVPSVRRLELVISRE